VKCGGVVAESGDKLSELLEPVFTRLRRLLLGHVTGLAVNKDAANHFSLEAPVGPATLKAWGGKQKASRMPVAWVEVRKNYVSYHLMGIYMNPRLEARLSERLRAHMHGKSCFNFKSVDESLFKELDNVTEASLVALRKGGYVVDSGP
jgi:hypothetical protein